MTLDALSTPEEMPAGVAEPPLEMHTLIPPTIMIAAVLFNPLLAMVNANLRPLTSSIVILCEIAIVSAALGYALLRHDRRMNIWLLYLGMLAAFAVVRTLGTGAFEVKYLRDLMMIPVFVMLGIAASERRVVGGMQLLVGVVVGCVLLEAAAVDRYAALFNIKDYYINTRGIAAGEFTNEESTLFISATRPEARYFPFFDLHRLSSVFLEPVSFGNFAVILVCFTAAFWRRLLSWQRIFLVGAIVLILFAGDGRFSGLAALAVLLLVVLGPLLPQNIALVFLPIVTAMTIAAAMLGDLRIGTDDFAGRLAHTSHWLGQMWLSDLLGVSNRLLPEAEDSGIVYLLITQSLAGLALLWCMISTALPERCAAQQHYKNGICMYLALTMMISFAFVSIKTAAPMWIVYGLLIGMGGREEHDEASASASAARA